MGQYWDVLNIDKREIAMNSGGRKLAEMLPSMGQRLLGVLVKPHFTSIEEWKRSVKGAKSQSSRLLHIPPETLGQILDYMTNGADFICLALTCKMLWIKLQERVRECITDEYAHWAGDRILIKGDYAVSLPGKLKEEPEVNVLLTDDCEWPIFPGASRREEVVRRLASEVRRQVNCPEYDFELQPRQRRLRSAHPWKLGTRSVALFPPEKPWILRNLTERKYVCLNAVVPISQRKSFHPPFVRGLVELLLYVANWTDDPSGVLGDSCHGEWAGHRFDVTVLDDVTTDESWTDVSECFSRFADEAEELC